MNPEAPIPADEPVTHTVVRPGDVYTFQDNEGRDYPVQIEDSRWIGEGGFGVIYEVRCRIGELLQGTASPTFGEPVIRVIKSFQFHGDALPAKRKHDMLARYGLPVFPVYHLNDPKEMILMPNGNEGGHLTVSQNKSLAREDLERRPLQGIASFGNLLKSLSKIVRRATLFGILVPHDAYFFFVQREGADGWVFASVDDADNVEGGNAVLGTNLVAENIRSVTNALEIFLSYAIAEPWRRIYLEKTKPYFEALGRELTAEVRRIQDV